ncbi:MAG: guanylate kinase [Nanobdellota archaeon]
MNQGKLIIISAPSGAGKDTVLSEVRAQMPELERPTTYTTRQPRSGEVNGKTYHFISREHFKEMIEQDIFIEWAEVHDNLYGTSRKTVEENLNQGKKLIKDWDVQGAFQLKKAFGNDCVLIFIKPPSMEELERRLRKRKTDDEETIKRRIQNARQELEQAEYFDYKVVNDNVEKAIEEVKDIIKTTTTIFKEN